MDGKLMAMTCEPEYLFSKDFICPKVQAALPDGFLIRPLRRCDYDHGFLETLRDLSTVADITPAEFEAQFDNMKKKEDTYFIVVIEDATNKKVVATGTAMVEMKFIHGGGKAAHFEDIVVSQDYRNIGLGRSIHEARDFIVKQTGCYKGVLESRNYNVPFREKAGYTPTGVYMKKM